MLETRRIRHYKFFFRSFFLPSLSLSELTPFRAVWGDGGGAVAAAAAEK
jgi:hypothetical protein